ncbi:MAG: hypothetical protein JSV88_12805 [Candidatus Aminicenantes bacterium]|nr:MAG: hypothetical protein JSV88_12805 [Candidatus Aminicenantes bacterium]
MRVRKFLSISILTAIFFGGAQIFPKDHYALLISGFKSGKGTKASYNANACSVIRRDGTVEKPEYFMKLFPGDKIVQKSGVQKIDIKFSYPILVKKLDKETLLITSKPPENKKNILAKLLEFIGFKRYEHKKRPAVTKGGTDIFPPLPGYKATVLPNDPILFSWGSCKGNPKKIVFMDNRGKKVFEKEIMGKDRLALTPEDIGMQVSKIYYWKVQGLNTSEKYRLTLLDHEFSSQVLADLKKIDEEEIRETEKKLKKAFYLQFISNTYEKEVDLYWISYKILKEIKRTGLNEQEFEDRRILIEAYQNHWKEYCENK